MQRPRFVLLVLVTLTFPLWLASQSADTNRSAVFAELSPGGCAAWSASPSPSSDQAGHGLDLGNLDRSVSPCDDFFKFADGGWIKNNPIPPAYPAWATFTKLRDQNEGVLHDILEEAAKDRSGKPGPNWQKIGSFYASCMDETQIEAAELKPLEPEFRDISEIKDAAGLQAEVARLHRDGVSALFRFGSEQDFKDSTKEIAAARQGGLGLPDRDYYLNDDDSSKKLRDAYVLHVTNMFKLMGDDDTAAAAEAKTVLGIETLLAKASMKRVDLRDPNNVYHKMSLVQLRELTPHFSWEEFLRETDTPAVDAINIGQPEFFKEVDAAFASVPLADWKTYLRWHLVHSAAQSLPGKFVDEDFNFYGRTLMGTHELLPRWRRCVQATDRQLGEALGEYYVKRNFPPEAKAKANAMVKNLIAALRDDLSTLDWMSPATRQKALEKLDAITPKIGYPDKWRDYSKFKVDRGPYVENVRRGGEFEFARDLAKIGKPVDRTEWGMTPPTVNAYYSPSRNEIVFPAGILQPPFYDPNRDDAMNYGGIGAVIGHEMTHGFDDQGAKFDRQGNLVNWWTSEDLKNFQARGDCIAKQFDGYEVEAGLHENGKLVEGESIADLGGLAISLVAFHKSLEGKPEPASIDGFTADQRYFLAFAQIWANNTRAEFARLQVKTNPHPLGEFRANGPLSNMPAFAKAFGCRANSPMVRPEAQRCRIW
jgi:putative endopeptidase